MSLGSPIRIAPKKASAIRYFGVPDAEIEAAREASKLSKAKETRGILPTFVDSASAMGQAALGGVQAVSDFIDPASGVSNTLRDLPQYWEGLESPQLKARKEVWAKEDNAIGPDASWVDRASLTARQASQDIPGTLAKIPGSLLPMVASGPLAPVTAAMIGGGSVRGGAYDAIQNAKHEELLGDERYALLIASGVPPVEAKNRLAEAVSSFEESGGKIAAGTAIGAILGRMGAETAVSRALASTGTKALVEDAAKLGATNMLRGGLKEAGSEVVEEGSQQYLANVAAGGGGAQIDPFQNVVEGAVEGGLLGLGGGAGMNVLTGASARAQLRAMGLDSTGEPVPEPVVPIKDRTKIVSQNEQIKNVLAPKNEDIFDLVEPTDEEVAETEDELDAQAIAEMELPTAEDEFINALGLQTEQKAKPVAIPQTLPPVSGTDYSGQFEALASGPTEDPAIERARAAFDAGAIESPDELRAYAEAGYPPIDQSLPPVADALEVVDEAPVLEEVPEAPAPSPVSPELQVLPEAVPVAEGDSSALRPVESVETPLAPTELTAPVENLEVADAPAETPTDVGTVERINPVGASVDLPAAEEARQPVGTVETKDGPVSGPARVDDASTGVAVQSAENVAQPATKVKERVGAGLVEALNAERAAGPQETETKPEPKQTGIIYGGDSVLIDGKLGEAVGPQKRGMVTVRFPDGTVRTERTSKVKKAVQKTKPALEVVEQPLPKDTNEIVAQAKANIPANAPNKAEIEAAIDDYAANPDHNKLGAIYRALEKAGAYKREPNAAFKEAAKAIKEKRDPVQAVMAIGYEEKDAKKVSAKAKTWLDNQPPEFSRNPSMEEFVASLDKQFPTRPLDLGPMPRLPGEDGILGTVERLKNALSRVRRDVESKIERMTEKPMTEAMWQFYNGIKDSARAALYANSYKAKIGNTRFSVADFEGDVDSSVITDLARITGDLAGRVQSVAKRLASAAGTSDTAFDGFAPAGNFAGVHFKGKIYLNPLKHLRGGSQRIARNLLNTLVHEMVHANGFRAHDLAFQKEESRIWDAIDKANLIAGMEKEIAGYFTNDNISRLSKIYDTAEKRWFDARRKARTAESTESKGRQSDRTVPRVSTEGDRASGVSPPDGDRKSDGGTRKSERGPSQELGTVADDGRVDEAVSGEADRDSVLEKPEFSRDVESGPFFSQLERASRQMKQPMKGSDALRFLSTREGVKAAELKWTGLDDFLQSKERVTPEEVREFLKANKVTVKEIRKGDPLEKPKAVFWHRKSKDRFDRIEIDDPVSVDSSESMYAKDVENGLAFWADAGGNEISKEEASARAEEVRKYWNSIENGSGKTKFPGYQLPGGKNYREVLLTLPSKEKPVDGYVKHDPSNKEYPLAIIVNGKEVNRSKHEAIAPDILEDELARTRKIAKEADSFRSGHWSEPNILAHVRFNERTDSQGKRVLFLEEIQSDWAQKGRREEFRRTVFVPQNMNSLNPGPEFATKKEAEEYVSRLPESIRSTIEIQSYPKGDVPLAPFVEKTEDWTALALKSVLHYAAANGFDSVAWTPGDIQNVRYKEALLKAIDNVEVWENSDGTFDFQANKDDLPIQKEYGVSAARLHEVFGKAGEEIVDAAKKAEGEVAKVQAVDMTVGGAGMRAFYDRIVPQVAEKIGKKFGAKIGKTQIDVSGGEALTGNESSPDGVLNAQSISISQEMRDSITEEGLPLFSRDSEEFELPKDTKAQEAVYNLVDKFAKIKTAQELVQEKTGKKADFDLHEAAIAVSPQTAHELRQISDFMVEPITKMIGENKLTLKDVDSYLWHSENQLGEIDEERADASKRFVKSVESGPKAEAFKEIKKAILDIAARGNARAISSGLPAKMEVNISGPEEGVFQRIIEKSAKAIVKANENKFRKRVSKFFAANPSKEWAINPKNTSGGKVITFFVDGKRQRIWIKDPVLASQIENLSDGETGWFLDNVRRLTRGFAVLNTRANPVFPVKNFIRDLTFGLGKIYVEDGPEMMRKTLSGLGDAIKTMWKYSKDSQYGAKLDKNSKEYKQWATAELMHSAGGIPEWFGLPSEQKIKTRLDLAIKEWSGDKSGDAVKGFVRFWNAVKMLSEASEGATRLAYLSALYDVSKGAKNPISLQEAIKKTRGITGDFQRHGNNKVMRYSYAFFNSAIQGGDAMVKLTQELRDGNPRARNLAAFLFSVGAAQVLIGMAAGDSDDDDQNDYEQLPEYLKNSNLIIPVPGHPVAIPLPYGLNVPIVLGMGVFRSLLSDEPDAAAKSAINVVQAIQKSFNPLGDEASLGQILSPTITDPIAQAEGNLDSLGRPIYRNRYYGEEALPESEIVSRKDSAPAKAIAKGLNRLGFGDEITPAKLSFMDVHPAVIDNTVAWTFGSAGKFLKDLGLSALSTIKGETPEKVPLWNDFVKTPRNHFYTGRFWDQLEEIRGLKDSARQLDENARRDQLLELGMDPEIVETFTRDDLKKRVALSRERADRISKEVEQIAGNRAKLLPMYEDTKKQIAALQKSGDPNADDKIVELVKAVNRKYIEATR